MTKAVLLCAGIGSRLGPLTRNCPKVMIPLNGKPLLQYHLEWLKTYGITELFVNLHYLPNVITDFLGEGEKFGVRIRYFREEILLGTAGALNAMRDALTETFLVHYGDVYSEVNIDALYAVHRDKNAAATMVVQPTDRPQDSDIVELDSYNRVTALHKNPGNFRYGNYGSAALYVLEPSILKHIQAGDQEQDFVRDVFPKAISSGQSVVGYVAEGYMQDIGTMQRYEALLKKLNA